MVDRIKLSAFHAAWYTQNKYDLPEDQQFGIDYQEYHMKQFGMYYQELQTLVVPTYMSDRDLGALLQFIYATSEFAQTLRGRGLGSVRSANQIKQTKEADTEEDRVDFKNSTFDPSEEMIETIEKLAEHSTWVALNDRARLHAEKEHDEHIVEDNYQKLLVLFANKLQIITEEAENKRNREKEQTESQSRAKKAIERLGGDWKISDHEETFHINTRTMEVKFSTETMNIEVLSDGLHLHHHGTNNVWALELDSNEDHMFCRHLTDETRHCHWERMIPSSSLGPEQMKEIDEAVKRHLRRGQTQESKFESVNVFVQELNAIMQKRPKTSQQKIAERIQQVYPESWQREQFPLKRLCILPETWFVTVNERKKTILEILRADLAKGPNQEYTSATKLLDVTGFTEWLMN